MLDLDEEAIKMKQSRLLLGNCGNFNVTLEFEVRMWVWIYQIFERDQIPIHHLSNKSNPNTNKPKDFWIRPNINERHERLLNDLQIGEKLRSNNS